jgi:hypothetical protein
MVPFTIPELRRRIGPRVQVETFCSEHASTGGEDFERHALILDMSEDGLRVQRPIGGPRTRSLQLEFEIPEVDEVVWAQGEICFDEVWQVPATEPGGLSGILRTSGIRLLSTAARHQRLLREYVNDTWTTLRRQEDDDWILRSACYARG